NGQRLIAFLALHAGQRDRAFVAANLWTDRPELRASACLRTVVWKVRRAVPDVLQFESRTIGLSGAVSTDLDVVTSPSRPEVPPLEPLQAADLQHELLADWYDDWVVVERERLRQRRLHLLESTCRRLSEAGRHAQAVDFGQIVVACEPLRESGQ